MCISLVASIQQTGHPTHHLEQSLGYQILPLSFTVAKTKCFFPCPTRYEDEINKRTTAENDFVTLKKVSNGVRVGVGVKKGNPILAVFQHTHTNHCFKENDQVRPGRQCRRMGAHAVEPTQIKT